MDFGLIYRLQDFIRNLTLESGFAFSSHLARVIGKALVKVGKAYKSRFLLWVGIICAGFSITNSFIAFFCSFYFNDEYDPATIGYALWEFVVSTFKNLKTIFKAQKELKKLHRRNPEPVVESENEERRDLTGGGEKV